MERKIADKFFNNSATPKESKRVLEWFDTLEGRNYLEEKLDNDFDLMDDENIQSMISGLDSDRMYESIQDRIRKRQIDTKSRTDLLGPVLKVAAAILVVFTAYLFFDLTYDPYPDPIAESEPILFQTSEDQQSEITLGDGSEIRLNSNSEILIPGDFMHETREVTLSGEAYFDVNHNPEKPFIIHSNQSKIEVLGTAFNVKSKSNRNDVQVAVVEGIVSFSSTASDLEEHSVVLKEGQYGYMDVDKRLITVDDFAVENYLAWKNGRLVFENLTLVQVCTQLDRLYDVQCSYDKESFKDLRLTANFSSNSVDRTLSVISLTLKVDFEREDNRVHWTGKIQSGDQKESNQDIRIYTK